MPFFRQDASVKVERTKIEIRVVHGKESAGAGDGGLAVISMDVALPNQREMVSV